MGHPKTIYLSRTLSGPPATRRPFAHRECCLGHPPEHFWQARYYDFNVRTAKKRIEKLRYIHRNPVKR